MMKIFITVFTSLIVLLAFHFSEAREPAAKGFTCVYQSGKIHFKTTGKTKIEAREKASHICFDRHMALLDQRGSATDETQDLMVIDECVNVCD